MGHRRRKINKRKNWENFIYPAIGKNFNIDLLTYFDLQIKLYGTGVKMKKEYRVMQYAFTPHENKDYQISEWIRIIGNHIDHYNVECPSIAHDHLKFFSEYEERRSTAKQRWQARKIQRSIQSIENLKPESQEKRKM